MGTLCTFVLFSSDSARAAGDMESLIHVLEATDRELSTWKENSILSRLNGQPIGLPFQVGLPIYNLLVSLRNWSEATERAFDPTVGYLMKTYESRSGGRWPSSAAVAAALQNTGMQYYDFAGDPGWVVKTRDIEIDSGAFGKGEALDRLLGAAKSDSRWLVDLGGQVLVCGTPPDDGLWHVAVAHPKKRNEAYFSIGLKSGSLATSGGSERDLKVDNRRMGHILNPNLGRPAEFAGSVSVWHETALVADILSTALYVMGPKQGLLWADSRYIAVCYLKLDQHGDVEMISSRAFKDYFFRKPQS